MGETKVTEPRLTRFRGKWVAYWRENGQPKREIMGRGHDRVEAEKAFLEWRDTTRSEPQDIGDIIEAYIAARWDHIAAPHVLKEDYAILAPFWAERPVEAVTEETCKEFHKWRGYHLSNGTVRKQLETLRAALRWAEKKNIIDRAPHVWLPKKPLPRDRYLSRTEAELLLNSFPSPHTRLFTIVALNTSARPGAILDLEWSRVDLNRRLIDLRNPEKEVTKKRRTIVPMNDSLFEALVEAKEQRTSNAVIEYSGKKIADIKKSFNTGVKRSGIPHCSPNTLRHTAAVWMAEAGVPMEEISQYMGHDDQKTTERIYARYSPEYLSKAAAALQFGGPNRTPRLSAQGG